jgi:hypothetical protein
MAQNLTIKMTEPAPNGRPFTKRFTKGTRAEQIAFMQDVLAATAGDSVSQQESKPLAGADLGVPSAETAYSDATLYFIKGTEEDSYDFEQLVNSVGDGAGGIDVSDPLMTAIESTFVGKDGATGWTLVKGLYHR